MRKYIVYTNDCTKDFTDMNLAMGYMNQMTKKGEKGEFHLTIRDGEDNNTNNRMNEIKALEHELKDMIGTFQSFQDNYAKFMTSCHDLMADMQIKLYNLKKQKHAK